MTTSARNLTPVFAGLVLLLGPPTWAQEGRSDEEAMQLAREAARTIQGAFNSHDPAAVVARHTPDAERIIVTEGRVTRRERGRVEIESAYAALLSKNPRVKATIAAESARRLASDLFLYEGTWEFRDLTEAGPSRGRFAAVLRKHEGTWRTAWALLVVAPPGAGE